MIHYYGQAEKTSHLASWWQPKGWTRMSAPEAFVTAMASGDDNWARSLSMAGYDRYHSTDDYERLVFEVWHHSDTQHLCVLFMGLGPEVVFFVDEPFIAPFLVDKYPSLVAAGDSEKIVDALAALSKTIAAWVRHGSGTGVISADGAYSADDRRRAAELAEGRKAEARAKDRQAAKDREP